VSGSDACQGKPTFCITIMELRHLRYFVAVTEALNFTKAAVKLRLAQPALSRQVSDFEDELGVDLLKCSSHGVVLTAEGKPFLEQVREILKRVDESVMSVWALFILRLPANV
jgi:DNA-binding transcriptional LysR family regulator